MSLEPRSTAYSDKVQLALLLLAVAQGHPSVEALDCEEFFAKGYLDQAQVGDTGEYEPYLTDLGREAVVTALRWAMSRRDLQL